MKSHDCVAEQVRELILFKTTGHILLAEVFPSGIVQVDILATKFSCTNIYIVISF